MTTRHEKAKAEAEELLRLREKHKQSACECANCGKCPLSSKDPLSSIVLADPETGRNCAGCKAILDSVDAFYVTAIPPRGVDATG